MTARKLRKYAESVFAGLALCAIALFFMTVFCLLSIVSGILGMLETSDIDLFPDILNAPADIYGGL